MVSGKFITFEGIDGAGKSIHIAFVTDLLRKQGLKVIPTREPGGTDLGETLREILLHQKMHLETEAMLMFASRREHLAQVIEPALARGDWVISDRFTDATFAYQGGGRKLSLAKLEVLEKWVHPHLQPDLTWIFDVSPEVARMRLAQSSTPDKFEQEKSNFFTATRAEYLRRAAQFPQRFRVIDATKIISEVQQILARTISNLCAG